MQDAAGYQQVRGLLAGLFRDFFQNGTEDAAWPNGQVLQLLSLLQFGFSVRDAGQKQ